VKPFDAHSQVVFGFSQAFEVTPQFLVGKVSKIQPNQARSSSQSSGNEAIIF